MPRLVRFYKPFRVLCQFRESGERTTLKHFIDDATVHPAGRLDFDSEGLVVLTDDGRLQARIAEPRFKLPKTYLTFVEGAPTQDVLARLCAGVELRDGISRVNSSRRISAPRIAERDPPVPPHRAQNATWLEVVMTSGRNREVRRLLAAAGHPVLRLVRTRVGPWHIGDLQPGEWRTEEVHLELTDRRGRKPGSV